MATSIAKAMVGSKVKSVTKELEGISYKLVQAVDFSRCYRSVWLAMHGSFASFHTAV